MPSPQPPFILADNVFDRINLYPQGRIAQIDPSDLLLSYSPGDTLPGETFARATTATYYDINLQVASAGINVKRDSHYGFNGASRSILLEDARTNAWSKSQEFDDVAWPKVAATVTPNAVAAPDGTLTADKLCEDNTNNGHQISRVIATTASSPQPVTVFAKAADRTWIRLASQDRAGTVRHSWVNLATGAIGTKDANHTIVVTPLANAWFRLELVFDSGVGAGAVTWFACVATADLVAGYLGTTGFGIYIWGGQHEQDTPFASSYIPTTTTALTRAADYYGLPAPPPQEMTVYEKFINLGIVGNGRYFWSITNAVASVPEIVQYAPAQLPAVFHGNGVSSVQSVLAVAPAAFDTDELSTRLYADGSVDTTQSINGVSATTSARTAALVLAPAWIAGAVVWLNSAGTLAGFNRFVTIQSFKIGAGARSLAEMSARMSSPSVVGREPNYAADYRRERSLYQAAVSAANQGLVADLGPGITQICDSCWIDRGHNLWGKTIKISAGDDGVSYPEEASLVVPAQGTVGGDPTTWSVTEEGAIYLLFAGFTARRYWRVTVTDVWQPLITGIILGKRVQLSSPAGWSSVLDEDAGDRNDRTETGYVMGYDGSDRTYSGRKVDLKLAYIGATEYDASIRGLRRTLFDINQPAVVCMNYGTNPERAWLYKYSGKSWSSPKTRTYRTVSISMAEVGPLIR